MADEDSFQFLPAERFKFPVLAQLFKFQNIGSSHGKNARCEGCLKVALLYKQDRPIDHALKCADSDHELKDSLRLQISELEIVEEAKKKRASLALESSKQNELDTALTDMIAIQMLPSSLVESYHFKHFCSLSCILREHRKIF